jgi:hypothetical protein
VGVKKAQNSQKLVNLTRESKELNFSGDTKLTPKKDLGQKIFLKNDPKPVGGG